MLKRLVVTVLVLTAPILASGAAETEIFTTMGPNAKPLGWIPATGPVDAPAVADEGRGVAGLTVHEWGTFTSVAGPDGRAIEWLPAGGPTDLPCFVAMSDHAGLKVGIGPDEQLAGRAAVARIRMETPVLYFYAPREEMVNVKVSMPHGLMTEWYPAAKVGPDQIWQAAKNLPAATGTIEWNNVRVRPGATENYPLEPGDSHYYAARRTGSAPLEVPAAQGKAGGPQHEKFLFYRGVASFEPPIAAQPTETGGVAVTNLGAEEIPSVVLFENRGGKIGYRIHGRLSNPGGKNPAAHPVTLARPELTATFASLQHDLEGILESQGMYPLEARAMVDTWKDTWFEQGTRIFYIVPSRTVDQLLPLEVKPAPVSVARAFVGRMEVITPATHQEVREAISKNDRETLETYGRFLEPILHNNSFLTDRISEADRATASKMIASIRAGYVAAVKACTQGKRQQQW